MLVFIYLCRASGVKCQAASTEWTAILLCTACARSSRKALRPSSTDDRPRSSHFHSQADVHSVNHVLHFYFYSPLHFLSSRLCIRPRSKDSTLLGLTTTFPGPHLRQQEKDASQEGSQGGEAAARTAREQPQEWHRMYAANDLPQRLSNHHADIDARSVSPTSVNRPSSRR